MTKIPHESLGYYYDVSTVLLRTMPMRHDLINRGES